LPTADPGKIRRIGGQDPVAGFVNFSADSSQIVYTIRVDNKFVTVVEAVDGSELERVLTSADLSLALGFVPGKNDEVIISREGETIRLDLESGQEQQVLAEWTDAMASSPNEQETLLWTRDRIYYWIDLPNDQAETLDKISGYYLVTARENPNARWLYFIDSPAIGEGRHVMVLDWETGKVRELLALTEPFGLFGRPRNLSSLDGQLALAVAWAQDSQVTQLWLLNAQTGEARLVAENSESRGVNGAISPDNNWIAVSTLNRDGDVWHYELVLTPAAGGEPKALGAGYSPIWVHP
jgi:hypothetical protein